jgi:anti-sigma regulatory factor (Ser/Thr protein kinase)
VPTVTVSFTPLHEHVRTARFIAASVARRAGFTDGVVDEIRLAVSEACSLAVRFHQAHAPAAPVEVRLIESPEQFSVEVADCVGRPEPDADDDWTFDLTDEDVGGLDGGGRVDLGGHERIGLAVISGLVDDVSVQYLAAGSVVTMTWPVGSLT